MTSTNQFHISSGWQPVMREFGLDIETIFTHPEIRAWRKLSDRENCTLDAQTSEGRRRLHVKRYARSIHDRSPAAEEFAGHELLIRHGIPTANLVGWGETKNGR